MYVNLRYVNTFLVCFQWNVTPYILLVFLFPILTVKKNYYSTIIIIIYQHQSIKPK